ncbi:MAG: glycoside hydrolase family 3 C-terminal domain-containing protein [Bryobacteraceae bacterium]
MRLLLVTSLTLLTAFAAASQTTTGWHLVWSDEFNGAAGSPPDPTKWNYDLGGGGWGNGEAETYTNSSNNVFQDGNGNLVIRAIRDSNGNYTSVRLQTGSPGASTHTADLSWQYGLVEARIKLPFGHGVWPAFWMLGEDYNSVGWPACGEVDIMENFGTFNNDLPINNGTAHGPTATGSTTDYNAGGQFTLPMGETVSDDYHVYAIQWSENSVAFYVDGAKYYTATPSLVPAGQWKFNAPFFLLLNLAIGGPTTFLGTPDPAAPFPNQDMLVDYVRVYQPIVVTTATPVITPAGVVNAASFLGDLSPGSLASLFGDNLADNTYQGAQVLDSNNHFLTSVAGVTVSVNGVNTPLIYVSPTQINFQVPWETAPSTSVSVQVTRAGVQSNVETITIASTAAPSMFLNDTSTGVAWITGTPTEGCPITQCAVQAGSTYQLWANGLGPKNLPEQDGVGDSATNLNDLSVVGGPAACQLTIGGNAATVTYCGAAPAFISDQLNFVYPTGVPAGTPVEAVLTVTNPTGRVLTLATGRFWLPAPATAAQLAKQMLAQMTPAEELQLLSGTGGTPSNDYALPNGAGGYIPGIPRLGIPALYFADGSLGVADSSRLATALPSSIASAAAWDLNLAYRFGSVIGAEASAYGLNVNLGGNTNMIGREPRDGRTFETKGEDPILAGKIAAQHVQAIQAQHVIGCVKHFAFNDEETGRTESNVLIDDRSGRESDLLAFEIGVKDSGVQSVMCSYNLLNGTWACENPYLLTQVLKTDWGFGGFVMSDWWAIPSAVPDGTVVAALAGLDQEQPNSVNFSAGQLEAAVAAGEIPQSRVDDMATRILTAMYQVGVFNQPAGVTSLDPAMVAADETIAQSVEEQGAVLLKNANGQLPLNAASVGSIAVIGSHADIGVLSGGGSAQVYPSEGVALYEGKPNPPGWAWVIWDPSSPMQAIRAAAPNASVGYNDGTNAITAAALAAESKVAIVFVSQWTSEGMDMPSLNFTDVIHSTPINQDALVAAVAAANPHTIVVMENGGAQVMPWLGSVGAVLETWFPGIRGGQAIANILFGSVNPSGKLPITFPASVNQLPRPVIPGSNSATAPFTTDYTIEGLKVGYKWYDSNNYTPEFPFGFGLSYTTFQLSNVALVNDLTASNPNFQVTFNLTNTGTAAGVEVEQVYLALPASTNEPPKRLVGWQKVPLAPGQQQSVTVEVDENDSSHPLSYWDTTSNSWLTAPGTYTVYVGDSSAQSSLQVAGTFQIGS